MNRLAGTRVAAFAASVLMAVAITSAQAQNSDAFVKANEEYAAGRFREAIELYNNVLQRGETSAALFYNLGNAWFRAGELGQAILQYQRALALEPQHPEAQANLRLARDKARGLELRQNWWDRIANRGTPAQYSLVTAISFWCAAFCIAAVLLRRRRSAPLKIFAALLFLIAAAAATALYLRETGSHGKAFAIVTAKNVQARLATADSAATVLVLPAGSEIKVLSERGEWMYAALPNELRGWIPAGSAERVRL